MLGRWGRLAALLTTYVAQSRRDPRRLLALVDSRRWPGRVRRMLDAFKQNPPPG
jgi:hypothetical protein